MPVGYAIAQIAIAFALFAAVRRQYRRRYMRAVIVVIAVGVASAGLAVERSESLSWAAMQLGVRDLTFLTNWTLAASAALSGVLASEAKTAAARLRCWFLSAAIVGVASWSYAWLLGSPRTDLAGKVDAKGICRQSSDDSCSAAAAAMLLSHSGIATDEAEMARLCMTRRGGTHPLGLYRGIVLKAAGSGLHAKVIRAHGPAELAHLHTWCIISVGVRPGLSKELAAEMEGYGWPAGLRHTIVVRDADPAGQWIDVADPSIGPEHWPTKHLEVLWDGYALYLSR